MSAAKYGLAGVALVLFASTAVAFQEQQSGTSANAGVPAAADSAAKPNTNLAAPDGANGSAAGTEVRIPGLGKLGNLPKIDFGLELLYGATDGKQPEPLQREENREDLTIRGSVKHSF